MKVELNTKHLYMFLWSTNESLTSLVCHWIGLVLHFRALCLNMFPLTCIIQNYTFKMLSAIGNGPIACSTTGQGPIACSTPGHGPKAILKI